MDDNIFFSGQFLLATPGMADPRFARSVVALCSHDENGALGINIGEPVQGIGFHDILQQFDIDSGAVPDRAVFLGGPVETQRGFILHSLDINMLDTLQVGNCWGLSSSVEMLGAIAQGRGPEKWIIALGYSGWGAGQLESELTQNGWTIAEGSPDWLYETESGDKWLMAWQDLGIDPTKLSSGFGSA
ncbi:YqgE/AlgH family protein [Parasphingorhabdus sp.]|uniref:YqgE/AlgH family protein n=1 Tax=Parasphingorhabdus sp. TaxID=2709688 RepID=UPI003593CF0D